MKWVLTLLLLVTASAFLVADPVKTKPPQHKPAANSSKKSVSRKSVPASSKKSARSSRTRGRRTRRAAAPAYQLHPDPSRYAEIQKALADRGYFKGEVNGQWNDDSVDALKRFQADQKLDPDGKINSLSLIGLGLGPKHDGSLVPPAAAPSVPHDSIPVAEPPPIPDTAPPPSAPPN